MKIWNATMVNIIDGNSKVYSWFELEITLKADMMQWQLLGFWGNDRWVWTPGKMLLRCCFSRLRMQDAEAGLLLYVLAFTLTFAPDFARSHLAEGFLFCIPSIFTFAAVQLFADLLTRCRGGQGSSFPATTAYLATEPSIRVTLPSSST